MRLAHGITDSRAKTALLAFAQELLQKAAQLEAATPTQAAAIPTEATGTAAAMLDTSDRTKKPRGFKLIHRKPPRSRSEHLRDMAWEWRATVQDESTHRDLALVAE